MFTAQVPTIPEFEGIVNNMERRYKESTSDWGPLGDRAGYDSLRLPRL